MTVNSVNLNSFQKITSNYAKYSNEEHENKFKSISEDYNTAESTDNEKNSFEKIVDHYSEFVEEEASKESTYTITDEGTSSQSADEVDDGKISFGSKIKNFFKGAGDTVKNAVKSLFTPKGLAKTALCVGACMIPIVGPFVAAGIGIAGAFKGLSKIVNGAQAADKATTDVEAEEAWQEMGGGAVQVAAGTTVVKTSGFLGCSRILASRPAVIAARTAGVATQLKDE